MIINLFSSSKISFCSIYQKGWKPNFNLQIEVGWLRRLDNVEWSEYVEMKKGIKINDMKGKWTDILINASLQEEDGFYKFGLMIN
jgi:hypothetical protein